MKIYNQQKVIYFDETLDHVTRLEAIRMLLAFSCIMGFKLFKMDVKRVFLNGYTQEEIYTDQPPCFINSAFPGHVFNHRKVLYGVK